MDDNQFMTEGRKENNNMHQEFAKVLSHLLHLPEDFIFQLMTNLDRESALYQKLYHLASSLDDKITRRQHVLGRNAVIKIEQMEKERVISWITASFLPEIQECSKENEVSLSETQIKNIDSFLYLFNANYFDSIHHKDHSVRREFLIKQLLQVICLDLKSAGRSSFDEEDAERIIKKCLFIPNDLKEALITEFRNSKVTSGKNISYAIIHHDVKGEKKAYIAAKTNSDAYDLPMFDIDNINDYIVTIQATEVSQNFQDLEIGSAEDLTWDVGFIQQVIKLMASNYHDELLAIDEDHSNFNLASKFLLQTMAYAVANRIDIVTSDVVIKSLANWDYLPFSIKMPIMDDIFASFDLDYSLHPYRHKQPDAGKQVQKVIQFRTAPKKEENL